MLCFKDGGGVCMSTLKAVDVANYIYVKYLREHHAKIDEMKMHKLLYFTQRESLIQTDTFMFDEVFYGWKYGPVLKEVRNLYKCNAFAENFDKVIASEQKKIIDAVYKQYSNKNSWSLSNLTHNEYSWKQSRKGLSEYDNGDVAIDSNDIRKDALLQKMQRMLNSSTEK